MARLQSSTGKRLEYRRIWSIHRARGLPGRRLQLWPGGRPTDKSMCLRSAMCEGTLLSSGQAGQCVQKPTMHWWIKRCDGPRGFHPMARDLYVPARRHYWRSQTSEFPWPWRGIILDPFGPSSFFCLNILKLSRGPLTWAIFGLIWKKSW